MENVEYINKNLKIKEMLNNIEKLMKSNEYNKAYKEAALILEMLNVQYIKKFYKEELENTDIAVITKYYSKCDEWLFEKMMFVNSLYELLESKITKDDLSNLMLIIDDIYKYMINRLNSNI